MVPVLSLWLPILLSAVAVFLLSFLIHMLLNYHWSDYQAVPKEDAVLDALRSFNLPPGDYMFPRPPNMKAMRSPEFTEKFARGPVGMLTVFKGGTMSMSKELVQWFVYAVVVSIFAAYVAGRAVPEGGNYLQVFRFAGVTAFLGYGMAHWQESIWYKKSWSTTIKNNIDALVYALFTAGIFGWLWP